VITRQATESDTDAVVEVWRASRAADGKRPSAAQLQQTREALTASASLLVVVDSGAGVAGFALGGWTGTDELTLLDLVVHPSGRRAGTGTVLIEALADAGYVKGARTLNATPDDERASLFLEACGLQPDGETWRGELEPPMRDVVAKVEGLRLGQLLKLAGLVDTGAEGKALLETGDVLVNGEVELRRGRQMTAGDVVTASSESVRVVPAL
jgi:ribosome-associated protein